MIFELGVLRTDVRNTFFLKKINHPSKMFIFLQFLKFSTRLLNWLFLKMMSCWWIFKILENAF